MVEAAHPCAMTASMVYLGLLELYTCTCASYQSLELEDKSCLSCVVLNIVQYCNAVDECK